MKRMPSVVWAISADGGATEEDGADLLSVMAWRVLPEAERLSERPRTLQRIDRSPKQASHSIIPRERESNGLEIGIVPTAVCQLRMG